MRKALIGAAKMSAVLGALALVLAFLGLYVMPALAAEIQFFAGNTTSFPNGIAYKTGNNYGFQITITNGTGAAGNATNVTFQLGKPDGTKLTYTNYSATTNQSILVKNETASIFHINFTQDQLGPAGIYNYTWFANTTVGNIWNSTPTIPFYVMANMTFNLTQVNASGVFAPTSGAGQGFLAQIVFSTPPLVASCTHNNMTVVYTQPMGSAVSILANNTCNYTATVTMTDYVSPTDQLYNSTFVISNLRMNSNANNSFVDIQLLPLGTYGRASPAQKSILGGFAFNDTNIRAIGSYQSASFSLARRGFMPDGLYQCANWSQATVGSNAQVCSNWAAATAPMTDSTSSNTTYLNKTITAGNFTFYGYSEPFYNLRPLVKAYGGAVNISNLTISWTNQRTRYYSWVPMIKFNMTSKQAYLPSSDAYADAMYYDVPFFANPTAIEMFAYNLTVNISFASNSEANISITPRIIRNSSNQDSSSNVLSGVETPLMPAWSVQDTDSFQGASVTRTILRPTFNTLYYSYNGTTCGPYSSATPIVPGSNNTRSVFINTTTTSSPCNTTISYDYSNNEMNLTLVNASAGVSTLSVLFALAGRPTTGMYSPIYLVNQTFLGGFIPGPGQTPPSPGTASTISFMVKVNNSLSNFTTTTGTDAFIHFLYPKNVTVWNNNSAINTTVNMGSLFQLWMLDNTDFLTNTTINATASGDVAANAVWMMIANETHLWNISTGTYNTTSPASFFVNSTFSCKANMTDSFADSPQAGQNISICFQEFDFNLTAINGWLPNDAKSNVTLNLTASLNVSILNEKKNTPGTAGSTNSYKASISTASAGEIKLNETQLTGFTSGNCGADFSNCSKTVIVDGATLNSSSYRIGSIILNLASGTHAVSVSYTVPAAAAATTTTTTSSGSSSTTVSDAAAGKVTKTFTSIAPYAPRTIYESELKDTNTGLTQIDISVKNLAVNVKITVEKLAAKTASITQEAVSANGMVYKFMNITKENLADKDIEKAKIKFKIEKSWLNANNFSALQIVLKRYTAQWDSLNTSMTSEDTSYAYYSADSPGFSVFAVAADKGVVTPVQPEQPAQPQQPSQETPQQQPSGTSPDMTVAYMLVAAVVIIGGFIYFMEMRKKKSDKKKK